MNEQAPASLCPGYKYVESFGNEEEYEDEEEVMYVTLDLGNVEPTLVPSSTEYRLITTKAGLRRLHHNLSSDLEISLYQRITLFSESHDRTKRPLVHVANTERRIAFKEVTLVPKGSAQDPRTSTAKAPKRPTTSSTKSSTKSKGKGKQKAPAVEVDVGDAEGEVNEDAPTEGQTLQIDRMTGSAPEPSRASRKRKSTAASNSATAQEGSSSSKGKERASRRQTRSQMDMDFGPGPAYSFQPPPLPEMQYSFPEAERQERMDVEMESSASTIPPPPPKPTPAFVIDPALLGPDERDDMDDMYVD
ncbi:hypothetical protein CVT24_000126 [Panaeolus cyanescens]|uniref:Uncharacterized protein n=1 Tax=Panaeolus cyanescens TaxID=181874 RepID=A0A409W7M7_9AGAR|nr:hypothetical protein CVT24_000126 [Panaeolus cyanescens]